MSAASSVRTLTSRDNPDFRHWLRLLKPSGRSRYGEILLEGVHLCQAWLDHMGMPPKVLVARTALALADVQSIWQAVAPAQRIVLDDALARALSQVQHGPALFFVVKPPAPKRPERLKETSLMLDRVQDPGNLGTLLRTAAAAGLRHVILSEGCAAAWSPKVLRSGQGAHFSLEVHEHADLHAWLDHLDIPLAATTLRCGRALHAQDLTPPCVWLFGNEGQGVDERLMERAQWRLRIAQAGGVESLNVAAAAAICLFEQRHQRLRAGLIAEPIQTDLIENLGGDFLD